MSFRTFKFSKIINSNGSLVPIDLKKFPNFKIKRFFILNGKKNDVREIMHIKMYSNFCTNYWKIELEISNKKTKKAINFRYKTQNRCLC